MKLTRRLRPVVAGLAFAAVLLTACGSSHAVTAPGTTPPTPSAATSGPPTSPPASPSPTEKPVPKESSPPGDIPDTTVFVPYHSTQGGFVVKVPEGWSRTTTSNSVSFTDKLNTITVVWNPAPSAPTVSSVTSQQVPQLQASERAFTLEKVLDCAPSCTIPYSTGPIKVSLKGGNAVVVKYGENSEPNAVTGKQYRLEVVRFDFFKNGVEADLILSGPLGADNVDPWRLVAESFQWS